MLGVNGQRRSQLQQRITQLNEENSRFIQLPGEIRNSIYSYVFCNKVIRETRTNTNSWRDPEMKFLPPQADSPGTWLSLLLVCFKIYSEAALIPWENNTYSVTRFINIIALLKKLYPDQRKAITDIQVEISGAFDMANRTREEFRLLSSTGRLRIDQYLPNVKHVVFVIFDDDSNVVDLEGVGTRRSIHWLSHLIRAANPRWANVEIVPAAGGNHSTYLQ
ncbi:hypothetical protein N0V90_012694 [Kalmusia sp. IMI 367209]|nr:hypothetical protein N0V90_012694 [Kalmusia sp. IMI 367209]